MSIRQIFQLIGRVLNGISDFLVVQNWDRALELFFTGGLNTDRILDRGMGDEAWIEPYQFKPLCLTEIGYPESDSEDDDDLQPLPRSGHRIVCLGNNSIYSFGGFNPEVDGSILFGELWHFDLLHYRWKRLLGPTDPGIPAELVSNAVCTSGKYILIYGGSGLPFGGQSSNRLHLCDTTKSPPTLTEIDNTTGEKPPPMYGQAIIVQDQYLYVVGGTSGFDYTCDVHRFTMKTRTWELIGPCRPERPDDPLGRYRHELAKDSEYIYVLGGGTSTEAFALDVIPAFQLSSNKWIQIQTNPDPRNGEYPAPRKFHSLVQLSNGQVFISGGCSGIVALRDIWRLDLETRTWTKFDKCRLPYRLFFHDAAATADGCMFVFGGVRDRTGAGQTRINNLYKVWLQVPSLKTIAAESLRHWVRVTGDCETFPPAYYRQYL